MSDRVTQKEIESLCAMLNRATGHAVDAYTKGSDGTIRANVGTYYIDMAYGGYKLVQLESEGGGVRNVTHDGFGTKRQLASAIRAMLEVVPARV